METPMVVCINSDASRASVSRNNEEPSGGALYKIEDRTPFVFSFFNALQILVCQVMSVLWLPLTMSQGLCLLPADAFRVYLVSTAFLTSGLATSIQSNLGVRLPTIAVPSLLYTSSLLSSLSPCPSPGDLYTMGPTLRAEEWQSRLREIQGALLFAGIFQAFLGFSGLQAILCHLLSPVSVAPAVVLAGLSLAREPLIQLKENWTIFSIVAFLIFLFSLWLRDVRLPLPTFSMHRGLTAKWFPVFRMFPVLWTCVAVYIIYKAVAMMSMSTPYPDERVIAFSEALDNSKWFFFPFPFEFGMPTLSISTVLHILPAMLLQSLLSVCMFYANAKTCGVSTPPRGAVSRGLGVEGVGLMFGSLWGQGIATDPVNIGLTSFTGMCSRSSTQLASLLMICLSHFSGFTSTLANLPIEFLSALHLCFLAGLVGVGISFLKFVNFSSPRDRSIVGISLFLGLIIPQQMTGTNIVFNTGLLGLDLFLSKILSSSVFVGVVIACLLDLVLPGRVHTKKFHPWKFQSEEDKKTYSLPTWEELMCSVLERFPFFSSD